MDNTVSRPTRERVPRPSRRLPRPERDFLIRVRTGKYSMEKVLSIAEKLFKECEAAVSASSLPEKIDRVAVSLLVAKAYRKAWDTD